MGGLVSCSIGNRYNQRIWVKYDAEKRYVQMEEYSIEVQVGLAEIELGAGVAVSKKYDWKRIETKFTPVDPMDFKELAIDCKDSKVMFVTIIAENDKIICNSWPINYKRVVVTKDAQLRKGVKNQPLKVHNKYKKIDFSWSMETKLKIQNARDNPVGTPNEKQLSVDLNNVLQEKTDLIMAKNLFSDRSGNANLNQVSYHNADDGDDDDVNADKDDNDEEDDDDNDESEKGEDVGVGVGSGDDNENNEFLMIMICEDNDYD